MSQRIIDMTIEIQSLKKSKEPRINKYNPDDKLAKTNTLDHIREVSIKQKI